MSVRRLAQSIPAPNQTGTLRAGAVLLLGIGPARAKAALNDRDWQRHDLVPVTRGRIVRSPASPTG